MRPSLCMLDDRVCAAGVCEATVYHLHVCEATPFGQLSYVVDVCRQRLDSDNLARGRNAREPAGLRAVIGARIEQRAMRQKAWVGEQK